ncbi:MAG: GNAT family N-acetyltransferase [Acidimicrobiales bacterium]|nr:GNAT family N-acetyltransferase [Acidimicrobiales bacterium]
MSFEVRRIEPGEGNALRDVRMAALVDEPRDASITLARTAKLSEDHWADAAVANSAGGLQATFFAVSEDHPADLPDELDAGDGGKSIVGLVGAYANKGGTVNLVGLWSAPGFRDVGVAEALLDAVRKWAVEHGHKRLRRWVVNRNEYAIAFYERTGFRSTGATMPYEPDPRLEQIETVLDL